MSETDHGLHPDDWPRQHDGRRFHSRVLGDEWQVFGYGLAHVAICKTEAMANMVADAMELAAAVAKLADDLRHVGR